MMLHHLQAKRSQTIICFLSLWVRLDSLGHRAKTGMTAQRMKCTGPRIPPQGHRLTWYYITTESGTPFLHRRLNPAAEVEDIQEHAQVLGVLQCLEFAPLNIAVHKMLHLQSSIVDLRSCIIITHTGLC